MNVGTLFVSSLRSKLCLFISPTCEEWWILANVKSLTHSHHLSNAYVLKNIISLDTIQKEDTLKTRTRESPVIKPELWKVVAYATAEKYDLVKLRDAVMEQDLYIPSELTSNEVLKSGVGPALHTIAKHQVSPENRHVYYFEVGTVVTWNMTEVEQNTVLEFLRPFESHSYDPWTILAEVQTMSYTYNNQSKGNHIQDGLICIGTVEKSLEDIASDRYVISNAISSSVKLRVLETMLDRYITDVDFMTNDLKFGHPLRFNKRDVLRKTGQLFSLKHSINLSKDFLDTPDFYWEREHLEALYKSACSYFRIERRIKVINEKVNNCIELFQLVKTHLSDEHHIRLEWMIIALISIEVFVEVFH